MIIFLLDNYSHNDCPPKLVFKPKDKNDDCDDNGDLDNYEMYFYIVCNSCIKTETIKDQRELILEKDKTIQELILMK